MRRARHKKVTSSLRERTEGTVKRALKKMFVKT